MLPLSPAHTAPSTSFGTSLPGITHLLEPPNPERRTINLDPSLDPPSPSTRFLLRPRPLPPAPSLTTLPSFADVLSATVPDLIRYDPHARLDVSMGSDDDEGHEEGRDEVGSEESRTEIEWRGPVMASRMRPKPSQLIKLVERWDETRFPTPEQRKETAAQTGLSNRQVQVWFQNRRMKEKKVGPSVRPLPQVDTPPKPPCEPAKPLAKVKRSGPRKISDRSIANLFQRRRGSPQPSTPQSVPQHISHPPPDPRYHPNLRSPYQPLPPHSYLSDQSTSRDDRYEDRHQAHIEPISYRPSTASSSSSDGSDRLGTPVSRPDSDHGYQRARDGADNEGKSWRTGRNPF